MGPVAPIHKPVEPIIVQAGGVLQAVWYQVFPRLNIAVAIDVRKARADQGLLACVQQRYNIDRIAGAPTPQQHVSARKMVRGHDVGKCIDDRLVRGRC